MISKTYFGQLGTLMRTMFVTEYLIMALFRERTLTGDGEWRRTAGALVVVHGEVNARSFVRV